LVKGTRLLLNRSRISTSPQPLLACGVCLRKFGFPRDANAAVDVEDAVHAHPMRRKSFYQVIQDLMDQVFMEDTLVA